MYCALILCRKKYKSGVEISKSQKNALLLDKNNETTFLLEGIGCQSISPDHLQVSIIPRPQRGGSHDNDFRRVLYNLIFAYKVGHCRKAQLIIDENCSPPVHKEDSYASDVLVIAI